MKPQLTFGPIELEDLPQIMRIEEQIYPNPWSVKIMHDCIDGGYQCVKGFYAQNPKQIACYAFLMLGFEEANLLNISVHPQLQRQSLASQMLHRMLLICRINHAKHIWLEVRESNLPAIKLYEKHHFKDIGRRKNYYKYQDHNHHTIKEHAIIMSRKVVL